MSQELRSWGFDTDDVEVGRKQTLTTLQSWCESFSANTLIIMMIRLCDILPVFGLCCTDRIGDVEMYIIEVSH